MGGLLSKNNIPIHHKCRNCGLICNPKRSPSRCVNAKYTRTENIIRTIVPNELVRWNLAFKYEPIEFTSDKINTNYKIDIPSKIPLNPCGRTGIIGRGHLRYYGPNYAADPVVTRWKHDNSNKIVYIYDKPVLQFVGIKRKDSKQLAIPGGMVDKGENVIQTLQREFHEEALNIPEMKTLPSTIKDIFDNKGVKIYTGYVDDPRNTDNSWIETTVYNFHDENNTNLGLLKLNGGDDALSAAWYDIDSNTSLYASHGDFLKSVVKLHSAHW